MTEREDTFILALDASTTAVGWCYARNTDYIASGVYKPESRNAWDRIGQIGLWLWDLIANMDANVVVLEEPTGRHGNARTDRLLGAVLGAARLACDMRGVEFALVNVMKVKATGFSKDNIAQTQWLVGKDHIYEDEADAIGTWRALLNQWLENSAEAATEPPASP